MGRQEHAPGLGQVWCLGSLWVGQVGQANSHTRESGTPGKLSLLRLADPLGKGTPPAV